MRSDHLRVGRVVSCGCHRRERSTKHGLARHVDRKEYAAWWSMVARCTKADDPSWKNYGARGIRVHQAWLRFEAFFADVGRAPSADLSLDRIDNAGHYEPGNVRWATAVEQASNKRTNVIVNVRGRDETLASACRALGLNADTIRDRMVRRGLTAAEAIALGAPK